MTYTPNALATARRVEKQLVEAYHQARRRALYHAKEYRNTIRLHPGKPAGRQMLEREIATAAACEARRELADHRWLISRMLEAGIVKGSSMSPRAWARRMARDAGYVD